MFQPLSRYFAAWLLALVASALLPIAASAQEGLPKAQFGDENIGVSLLAQDLPEPGKEWMLALRFTPSGEEWHGYWKNPGDAGQPMRVVFDLPQGWEAGEPLYPVPQRLVIGSLMNHIYKGAYAVLIPVRVPEGADRQAAREIEAYVDFLACTDRICVPQDARAPLQIGLGDFARWRAQIAPLLDAGARYAIAGEQLRLAIPLPSAAPLDDPHIFAAPERLVDYAGEQSFSRLGDELIATIPLKQEGARAEAPAVIEGVLAFDKDTGVRFEAALGTVLAGGEPVAGSANRALPPLWTLALGALVGGLILNIMPCVFPILSLKALALARSGHSEALARIEGVAYSAGAILACLALGGVMLALRAAGQQVGWAFQLQEPAIVVSLLVLAAAITANLAGVFELPAFAAGSSGAGAHKSGARGAFATGLLAAFVATPCTGPFMAAALGAALLLPVPLALLLFALLGLGLALPFLLLGFVPALRRALPKPGPWMETFRRVMAIPMGLTAIALVWLTAQLGGRGFALFALVVVFGAVVGLWVVGRLQSAGKLAWPAFGLVAAPFAVFGAVALPASYESNVARDDSSILAPRAFSSETLADARASGQPVFVWFTADWCVTCKVNEGIAIEREATRAAFEKAGVIPIRGDWTLRDEAITRFLTEQGAAGVPLYLWYAPGASEAEQLPQLLQAKMLSERAASPGNQQ